MPNHYPEYHPPTEKMLRIFYGDLSQCEKIYEIKPPLKCQLDENGEVTEANIILLNNIEISLKKLLEERYNRKFSDMKFIEVQHDKGNLLRGIVNKTVRR